MSRARRARRNSSAMTAASSRRGRARTTRPATSGTAYPASTTSSSHSCLRPARPPVGVQPRPHLGAKVLGRGRRDGHAVFSWLRLGAGARAGWDPSITHETHVPRRPRPARPHQSGCVPSHRACWVSSFSGAEKDDTRKAAAGGGAGRRPRKRTPARRRCAAPVCGAGHCHQRVISDFPSTKHSSQRGPSPARSLRQRSPRPRDASGCQQRRRLQGGVVPRHQRREAAAGTSGCRPDVRRPRHP